MIEVIRGDMFASNCDALVNTINCQGIMGGGLALAFRRKYPTMYENYVVQCKLRNIRVGKMHVYSVHNGPLIINFPTMHDFAPAQLQYITEGLYDLVRTIGVLDIKSIAIPALGCGIGGMDWDLVRPVMEHILEEVHTDVEIKIYEPQ